MRRIATPVMILTLALPLSVGAQTKQQPAPDNTKVNQQDRDGARPTPDQQKENPADLDITTKIRKALDQDKTLSTYAKNIKIVTTNGVVTLRGPVRSADEKKSIEAKATQIAGATHVKNELEIAAK